MTQPGPAAVGSEEPVSAREAEARTRAHERGDAQRQALRPLGLIFIAVVVILSVRTHPVPGLRGRGLGVTIALAVHAGQTHLGPAVQERLVAAVISRPPSQDPAGPAGPDPARPAGPSASGRPPDGLTIREAEVLSLLASGLSNAEIAQRLYLSHATVKTHINRIFAKTGVRDRAQVVRYAYRHGLSAPAD